MTGRVDLGGNVYCPSCGSPAAAEDAFCSGCGAKVSEPEATASSRTAGVDTYATPLPTYPPPSTGGFAQQPPDPASVGKRAAWPLGVAAGLVIVGLIVGGWWFAGREGDTSTAAAPTNSAPSTTAPATQRPTVSVEPDRAGSPDESAETVYVAPPRTVTMTTQPDRTVYVAPPEQAPAHQPVGAANSWVAVLDSLPQSSTSFDQAERRAAGLSRSGAPTPFVIDSTATPGLRPGYWAVVVGYYGSESGARSVCSSFGRSPGGSCYPRHIQ